jgi:UrcA family protein
MKTKITASLLLAPVPLACPASELAGADPEVHRTQAPVRLGDLDLSRPADVQALYGRIQERAFTLCASLYRRSVATRLQTASSCAAAAVDRTVASVDLPALRALHAARQGRPADASTARR